MTFIPLSAIEPDRPAPSTGVALLALAFRPFYLLAAIATAVLIPLWLWSLNGGWVPASGLSPMLWHGHEMLFGVMGAVVVGFLFTAGKTWTGLQTPRGAELAAFALVWVAARLAAPLAPYKVFFFLDVMFLPAAAIRFADLLWRSKNHRNLPVALVLGVLGFTNLIFHLQAIGALGSSAVWSLHAGLATLTMMETLIGGRVIPFFTRSATGQDVTVAPAVDRATIVLTVLALLAWLVRDTGALTGTLLVLAAGAQMLRVWCWRPWSTARHPILWALPLAYAWIPLGLLLLAVASLTAGGASSGLHALAVGAAGGLVIAMITRTARGHTGRPLRVGKSEIAAYVLVAVAAMTRVSAPLWGQAYPAAIGLAGVCFSAAFLIYTCVYASWLIAPRADGRPD